MFDYETDAWQSIPLSVNNHQRIREPKKDISNTREVVEKSPIQVGNVATPSNETDRLSYLHRHASINSHVWYTHTSRCVRCAFVCVSAVVRGRGDMGYQRATDPRTIHIYLRPKRNSRIYFTYALLPPYFQLYGHSPRKDRSGMRMHSVFTESRVD